MACNVNNYNNWKNEQIKKGIDLETIEQTWFNELVRHRQGNDLSMIEQLVSMNRSKDNNIAVSYGGRTEAKRLIDAKAEMYGNDLYFDNGVYTFKEGSEVSDPTANGKTITVPHMKHVKMNAADNLFASKEDSETTNGLLRDIEGYEKQKIDLMNDTKEAKKLVNELIELDGTRINKKQKSLLNNAMDMIIKPGSGTFKKMGFYLNRQAEKNFGAIALENGDIAVGVSNASATSGLDQSAAVKMVHEQIHAAVEYAIKDKGSETRITLQQIETIYRKAITEGGITWEQLLPEPEDSIDSRLEKKQAKELMEYMRSAGKDRDKGLNEFIAIAVTDERVANALSKMKKYKMTSSKQRADMTMFESLMALVDNLLNFVFSKVNKEDINVKNDEAMMILVSKIAESNDYGTRQAKHKNGIMQSIEDAVEKVEVYNKYLSKKFTDHQKKLVMSEIPSKKRDGLGFYPKYMWRTMNDPEARKPVYAMMGVFGAKSDGFIQQFVRNLHSADKSMRNAAAFMHLRGQVERNKESIEGVTQSNILTGFKDKLGRKDNIALGKGAVRVGLNSIIKKYSPEEISSFYGDDEAIDAELGRLETALSADKNKNFNKYLIRQSKGLGRYLSHGEVGGHQLMNADAIVSYYMNSTDMKDYKDAFPDYKVNEKAVRKIVDAYSTLEGIKGVDRQVRTRVKRLVDSDIDGIKNLAAYHDALESESLDRIYNKYSYVKGQTKDIGDAAKTMKYGPAKGAKARELEKMGYVKLRKIKVDHYTGVKDDIALYTNDKNVLEQWKRGAVGITSSAHGDTYKSLFNREINQSKNGWMTTQAGVDALTAAHTNRIFSGKDVKLDQTIAVRDEDGKVVDYKFAVNHLDRESIMGLDLAASNIIGRSTANLYDLAATVNLNDKILDEIVKESADNISKRNINRGGVIGT